jgi:hypothetical protein
MHLTSEHLLDGDVLEREFVLAQIPGVLWTPPSANPAAPFPLVLLGHPGGLGPMYPRLKARARHCVERGFAAVTIELPGSGQRPTISALEQARTELRQTIRAGTRPSEEVIDRLILPLVEQAVPEWQAALDDVLALRDVGGPVAISGGPTAVGVRLARVERRIVAASLFAGSFLPRAIIEEARAVTSPVHVLLQWDDHDNDRQMALDLFDALGSGEKTLQANLGGHTGIPPYAGEDAARFLVRHLTSVDP